MLKRVFKALTALSLAFVLVAMLGYSPLAKAGEEPSMAQEEYAGFLVTLAEPDPDRVYLYDAGELEAMCPINTGVQLYKVNDIHDIRGMVYDGLVLRAEPDYKAELFDIAVEPNDPRFRTGNYQEGLRAIGVQSAWDACLSGEGVMVAVIDSGLNTTHRDAPVKVAPGRFYFYYEMPNGRYEIDGKKYNYYSSDDVTDDHKNGHGSMCCGIVAANTNNGLDIAGIAPNATILPVRCFTNQEGYLGGYVSNLISGLDYASDSDPDRAKGWHADIISMSWGIQSYSETLKDAVDRASSKGCILIAAAGNDSSQSYRYPAAYPNVIGVGSVGLTGYISSFSQRNDSVDICAPGEGVYSIFNTSNTALGTGNGTSFSCPMVAGAAALLKEAHPEMSQSDFVSLLRREENCTPFQADDKHKSTISGSCKGILNIQSLLDAVGYAGVDFSPAPNGLLVRTTYHPSRDNVFPDGYLVLVGAYNKAGHLIQSAIHRAGRYDTGSAAYMTNTYRGYDVIQIPFPDPDGEIKSVRAFFLNAAASLAPAAPPAVADMEEEEELWQ